jgi:hypothetical protein
MKSVVTTLIAFMKGTSMAWTTPTNWSAGELLTAEDLNERVIDNLVALKSPSTAMEKGNGSGNYTVSTPGTSGYVVIDPALNLTVHTSTANSDIMIGMTGTVAVPTGNLIVYFDFEVDGTRLASYSTNGSLAAVQNNFSTFTMIAAVAPVTLARGLSAGDHVIKLVWRGTATSIVLYNSVLSIPTFWAREI